MDGIVQFFIDIFSVTEVQLTLAAAAGAIGKAIYDKLFKKPTV